MSLISSNSLFSESIESLGSKRESRTSDDNIFEVPHNKHNPEGFSSSLILNLENDPEKKSKPLSKLVNITQIVPGTQKTKKILLPIFYRRSISNASKSLLYLEQSNSDINKSNDSVKECVENRQEIKKETVKANRVTSTTFGSIHTLSNIDAEVHQELFTEKINFDYESEMKSSMHEGNLIAYCHKCKKETVTVMQQEKFKGFRGFKDLLLCCCSSLNTNGKAFVCPICLEVLVKTN
ncbi:hypothetical protein SteCoe_7610 [Stentor coeruleus]|uniref:LITAF domain-containing protein n=1 Tax=Stentor coeruleus TaxID=5963 RepID=A0A1R2CM84_9CILI|nr:hypothetical protein SteCoe_7610 [Stentor coeruleus]